jgi:hypothetical protein
MGFFKLNYLLKNLKFFVFVFCFSTSFVQILEDHTANYKLSERVNKFNHHFKIILSPKRNYLQRNSSAMFSNLHHQSDKLTVKKYY